MRTLLTTSALFGAIAVSSLQPVSAAIKQEVSFTSQGQTLAGDLYLPDNYQAGDKLPAVIVSGSWTSVKEQMAGGYAQKLADKGYAALAFDFRGWGESASGTPVALQYTENPLEKTKDIIAAAEFLAGRAEISTSHIATLGICASAGYAIDAAHQSDAISATAVVAPWLHDKDIVNQVYGDMIPTLMAASAEASEFGRAVILEAASDTNQQSVMYQAAYYTDSSRGAIPEYDNKFSTFSWAPWLNYDAIQTANVIEEPLLLVHSSAAAIPQGAQAFEERGGDNVHLVMLENVTQFDFYDAPDAMDSAVMLVDSHYRAAFE